MSKPIPINTKTKLITNYSSESCSSERYDAYKDPYEEEYEEYGDYGTPPTDYKSKNSQSVSREMGVGITIAAVGILTLSVIKKYSNS